MKLWTFQSNASITALQKNGILTAQWERYESQGWKTWKRAYEWMRDQMETKGIDCKGNAPIWAWHSCGGVYGKSPSLGDASNLLSLYDIEQGVQTIEFECPDELVLLSSYGKWNSDVLDYFIMGAKAVTLPTKKLQQLFEVNAQNLHEYDSIQATLPFLKQEWVVDIRPLKLEGNVDFEFDDEELV
ncbi:MAG: DUF3841 domain-containing protein [Chitinophagales bacterium]